MTVEGRSSEGGKALMWLTVLILGGLLFAAGVMVGRSMTPAAPVDQADPLERIDRRASLAVTDDGQLTFPQVLSGPPIQPPVTPAGGSRPDAGSGAEASHPRPVPDAGTPERAVAPTGSHTFYCLQVASFKEADQAEQMAQGLRAKGLAEIRVVGSEIPGKGQVYRVRLGRFEDREAAARYSSVHDLEGLVIAIEEP